MSRKKITKAKNGGETNGGNGSKEVQIDKNFNLKEKIFISAKTLNQKILLKSIKDNIITIVAGPAGTGKTKIAVVSALQDLFSKQYKKIIFSRPCVEASGENLGFLPGNFNEKIYPYMMPIFNFLDNYLEISHIEELVRTDVLVTLPLAYQRGWTFEDSFVVLDEAQGTTPQQMRMFLTRIGQNCKVVITGDPEQSDIKGQNGLVDCVSRLINLDNVGIVKMGEEDILRHPIVAAIEKRYKEEKS